jgi:tetratricopeptide (TPR) repeat protein
MARMAIPDQVIDYFTQNFIDRTKAVAIKAGSAAPVMDLAQVLERYNRQLAPPPASVWRCIKIDTPFPPCTYPVKDLESITLGALRHESHHRGKILLVRLVTPPRTDCTGITAAIEDTKSFLGAIYISFGALSVEPEHLLPKVGDWFATKEPYLTLNDGKIGASTFGTCVRVDHPSDLVSLRNLTEGLSEQLPVTESANDVVLLSPQQLKDAGNVALRAGYLHEAHASYTRGLHVCIDMPDPTYLDVKLDLNRNRAHVRLALCCYEGANADATSSLVLRSDTASKRLDAKAYFRAGRASYKLKLFTQAACFFKRQLELEPGESNGTQELIKTEARLHEQASGIYNLTAIRAKLSPAHPEVDAADFTANTVIRTSEGRGRGLFATRALDVGDLILAETAFCGVWGQEKAALTCLKWDARSPSKVLPSQVGLWKKIVHRIRHNPENSSGFLDLQGGYKGIGNKIINDDDGLRVVDTYQVYDLMVRNQFGLDGTLEQVERSIPTGVFMRASYLNHCCLSNTKRQIIGDLLLLYALKPIAEGEELTISYDDPIEDLSSRTELMKDKWNFACNCRLCEVESQDPIDVRKKREKLLDDAYDLMEDHPASFMTSDRAIANAEQLIRDITATYDDECFLGMPRLALIDIQNWLVQVFEEQRDDRSTQAAIALLSAIGYDVRMQGLQPMRIAPTINSLLPHLATAFIAPLKRAATAARSSGDTKTADGLSEALRKIERALLIDVVNTNG